MEIDSKIEKYRYVFRKADVSNIESFVKLMDQFKLKCDSVRSQMAVVGYLEPKEWKEHSVEDVVTDFDYSHLKLKSKPVIFLNVEGRSAYAAVHSITNERCKVYIHWNSLPTLPPMKEKSLTAADSAWRVQFCLYPQEGKEQESTFAKYPIKLEESLSTWQGVDEAIKKGRKLVVYEDQVLDVASFIERHAGTPSPLNSYIGGEVGRYIYGAFEHEGKRHTHSPLAMGLMSKYLCGIIKDEVGPELFSIKDDRNLRDVVWKLDEQEGLTDVHVLCKYRSDDVKITAPISKPNCFGRYLALSIPSKKITRNYVLVYNADEELTKAHHQLLRAIENNEDLAPLYPDVNSIEFPNLTTIVKTDGVFSSYVCDEANAGNELRIAGPFGRGFDIGEVAEGHIVGISAGTAVLFFLDLVLAMLRKNAFDMPKKYNIFKNEEFKWLSNPNFKFTLLCSFKSLNEAAYGGLLERIGKLCVSKGFKNLEIISRQGNLAPAHWGEEFYKAHVPTTATKIYLVGHQELVSSANECLLKLGHDASKIHYI